MNPSSYSVKFAHVLKSLENVPFYKKTPTLNGSLYNTQLFLTLLSGRPFRVTEDTAVSRAGCLGKPASPVTHFPTFETSVPYLTWQEGSRGESSVGR